MEWGGRVGVWLWWGGECMLVELGGVGYGPVKVGYRLLKRWEWEMQGRGRMEWDCTEDGVVVGRVGKWGKVEWQCRE